ncbi:MAG: transcriptional repressor [Gammaproteobacteria bacterium]
MNNPSTSRSYDTQRVNDLLAERGILPTQQRTVIAQVLFSQCRHLSADQVLGLVNQDRYRVSKATVYNTLGLFAREGLIRELVVDPSRVFYDPNVEGHHHFYNVDTGELTDIPADDISVSSLPDLPGGTLPDGVEVIVRVRNAN